MQNTVDMYSETVSTEGNKLNVAFTATTQRTWTEALQTAYTQNG